MLLPSDSARQRQLSRERGVTCAGIHFLTGAGTLILEGAADDRYFAWEDMGRPESAAMLIPRCVNSYYEKVPAKDAVWQKSQHYHPATTR